MYFLQTLFNINALKLSGKEHCKTCWATMEARKEDVVAFLGPKASYTHQVSAFVYAGWCPIDHRLES